MYNIVYTTSEASFFLPFVAKSFNCIGIFNVKYNMYLMIDVWNMDIEWTQGLIYLGEW
jgi:hypothetical protein